MFSLVLEIRVAHTNTQQNPLRRQIVLKDKTFPDGLSSSMWLQKKLSDWFLAACTSDSGNIYKLAKGKPVVVSGLDFFFFSFLFKIQKLKQQTQEATNKIGVA